MYVEQKGDMLNLTLSQGSGEWASVIQGAIVIVRTNVNIKPL